MLLRQIFDPYLAQYAYLIGCQRTGEALVIDPLRDIEQYRELAQANGLKISAVAETHIHADFVSGGQEFAADPGVRLYLSAMGGADWSYKWPGDRTGVHFLKDGDEFSIGNITVRAVHSPGHTPEHLSYLITDVGGGADSALALATGDFIFVGDVGRPDLLESAAGMAGVMEPSARLLAESLQRVVPPLEDYLQLLPGHGAGSACGKALGAVPVTTAGYERRFNRPLRQALGDGGAFVKEILAGQPEPPLYFATMKRVNRDGIRVTGGVPEVVEMDAAAFAKMAQEPEVAVLDARMDRVEFADAHAKRALYAPLRTSFFTAAAGSYVEEDQRMLLVAESAEDARLAAVQLYRIGLDGLAGWISVAAAKEAGLMSERMKRINFPDFKTEDAAIVDVRSAQEFADGHLNGAVSVPYTRLKKRLEELPQGKKLYVHCGTGKRAAPAASFLAAQGFNVVYVDGVCAECDRIAEQHGVTH